jgi:hypothetical protein
VGQRNPRRWWRQAELILRRRAPVLRHQEQEQWRRLRPCANRRRR